MKERTVSRMIASHWPHPAKNGVGVGDMEDGGRSSHDPGFLKDNCTIRKTTMSLYRTRIANKPFPLLPLKKENMGVRGGKDELGDWDWHIYTTMYKIGN